VFDKSFENVAALKNPRLMASKLELHSRITEQQAATVQFGAFNLPVL